MTIEQVKMDDIEQLAVLFDGYRQFYGKAQDLAACKAFLQQRLETEDSVIFVVKKDSQLLGFTQLYPSFSSVQMRRTFILNDLFVSIQGRKQGVAKALLEHAADYARQQKAAYLVLQTGTENHPAQQLYEKLGWKKDQATYYYELDLNSDK